MGVISGARPGSSAAGSSAGIGPGRGGASVSGAAGCRDRMPSRALLPISWERPKTAWGASLSNVAPDRMTCSAWTGRSGS